MPDIPASFWIGVDEAGGIPNPGRPDVTEPAHWRLDAIAATERPRQLDVASDGRTIAFVLDRDTSDVWTIDVFEPASPVRITTGRTLAAYWDDGGVVWSPNRQRLAFVAGGAVHVVAAAGGPPRSLCDGSSPVWLDDDRLVIAVDRGPRQVSTTALAVIAVDDPWPSPLAVGDGDRADVRVSPDRSAIASTLLHRDDLNCTSLHVTDVASATDRVVAVTPGRNVRAPAWSPDGARLAFADENPGWYEIHLVPADGSAAPTPLTNDDADFSELSWSADGTVILAVRSRHGVSDLTLVDASSGRVDVVAPGGTWSSPRWLRRRLDRRRARVARHGAAHLPDHGGGRPVEGGAAVRPHPGGGPGRSPRRPRPRHVPVLRRSGGARLAVRAAARIGGSAGAHGGPPPRRTDVRDGRRVGRHRPVLHRQGLRLVLAERPRQHDLRPRLRTGQPSRVGRPRHTGLPGRARPPRDIAVGGSGAGGDLRGELWLVPGARQPRRRSRAPLRVRGGEVWRLRHRHIVGAG